MKLTLWLTIFFLCLTTGLVAFADPDVLEVPEGETMTLYIRNFELLGV